jgi:diguanylate cyclase (GGDEF)-like protein
LFIVDIDRFHDFNSRYMYRNGNKALRAVAAAVSGALCQGDRALPLLGRRVHRLAVGHTAQRCQARCRARRSAVQALDIEHLDNPTGVLTVTVGVAGAGTGRPSADEVVESANVMLLEGKDAGRNRVVPA